MNAAEYDRDFRYRAQRWSAAGVAVLAAGALLWIWWLVLLLTGYEVDVPGYESTHECAGPLLADGHTSDLCVADPRWPLVALVGGGAVLTTLIGVAVRLYGRLSLRVSQHHEAMTTLGRPERKVPQS